MGVLAYGHHIQQSMIGSDEHSTFNIQHSTFNIQHSTFNVQGSLGRAGRAIWGTLQSATKVGGNPLIRPLGTWTRALPLARSWRTSVPQHGTNSFRRFPNGSSLPQGGEGWAQNCYPT